MKRQLLLSVFVSLVLIWQLNAHMSLRADPEAEEEEEYISLNDDLNQTQLAALPNNIFISEFVSFIFTGSYTGKIKENTAIDNNTLDQGLDFLLLGLSSILEEEIKYDPEYYQGK
jgi:hypothetical protein